MACAFFHSFKIVFARRPDEKNILKLEKVSGKTETRFRKKEFFDRISFLPGSCRQSLGKSRSFSFVKRKHGKRQNYFPKI